MENGNKVEKKNISEDTCWFSVNMLHCIYITPMIMKLQNNANENVYIFSL
jgi:hypothetical protein